MVKREVGDQVSARQSGGWQHRCGSIDGACIWIVRSVRPSVWPSPGLIPTPNSHARGEALDHDDEREELAEADHAALVIVHHLVMLHERSNGRE